MCAAQYLSITDLNRTLNDLLEEAFPQLFFEGEISQIQRSANGHLYFTLKDADSQISAVMWAGIARGLDFKPDAGAAVQCVGKPNLYSKSGRFQIVVNRMQLAGEGDLRKKFLMLKQKLSQEGFFSEERKRPLPFFPQAVGVVTSKTGAVIHDIMVKFRERMPQLKVYLVDARVQGPGAAEEIAAGIRLLNEARLVDIIIIARGGGSLEDLWAFNEEAVVKAVFASAVPVVSGVGHEVDVCLADLAADRRAPTPTAAAEMVVPRRQDLLERLAEQERRLRDLERWFYPLVQTFDELELRLQQRLKALLQEGHLRLAAAEAQLQALQPLKLLNMFHARVELLAEKLFAQAFRRLNATGQELQLIEKRFHGYSPLPAVTTALEGLSHKEQRLTRSVQQRFTQAGLVLDRLAATLESLSHRSVLRRGYALVEAGGRIVRNSADVKVDELLQVTLGKGALRALVSEKIKGE